MGHGAWGMGHGAWGISHKYLESICVYLRLSQKHLRFLHPSKNYAISIFYQLHPLENPLSNFLLI